MLEQLKDLDRFDKIQRRREFLLPRSDNFSANPLNIESLMKMADLEPNQNQVWIKPKDFANRIKSITGIIITENSLLYKIALEQHVTIIPYQSYP